MPFVETHIYHLHSTTLIQKGFLYYPSLCLFHLSFLYLYLVYLSLFASKSLYHICLSFLTQGVAAFLYGLGLCQLCQTHAFIYATSYI